ncbi:MAG: hypothetical protein JWM75_2173 [Sphingomonas bacterium]|nr:hypothetical protein [Sphingomonas bacterium]
MALSGWRSIEAAAAALAVIVLPCPAAAQPASSLRELCAERPGKDTPSCIVDAGHLLVETGLASVSRDRDGPMETLRSAFGEVLARLGVTDHSEVQLGFTPLGVVRIKDRSTGLQRTVHGPGDLTGAFKLNLRNPDGSGTSAAIRAFVTAPTGRSEIGAGAWEGGVIIPLSFDLSERWSLTLDPEIDLLGDEDGHGHHVALAGVVSLSHDLGHGLGASAELWTSFERDPADHSTQGSFDLALAWTPESQPNLQFDTEVDLGLTAATPGIEAALGISYRF